MSSPTKFLCRACIKADGANGAEGELTSLQDLNTSRKHCIKSEPCFFSKPSNVSVEMCSDIPNSLHLAGILLAFHYRSLFRSANLKFPDKKKINNVSMEMTTKNQQPFSKLTSGYERTHGKHSFKKGQSKSTFKYHSNLNLYETFLMTQIFINE